MSEIINTYALPDLDTVIPMDRDEFYDEQISLSEKGKEPTHAADIIAVFIFNTNGELLVQKRSYDKRHIQAFWINCWRACAVRRCL